MTKPIIAVIDTGYESYAYEKEILEPAGYQLRFFTGDETNHLLKQQFAQSATGLLIRGTPITADFLDSCPHLKAIVRYGVGYDNIDLAAAKDRGVKVAIVKGYGNHAVSDHALALIYACARDLNMGEKTLEQRFGKPPREDLFELHRKTLGIIGCGRIGSLLAKKSISLFDKVLVYDPYVKPIQYDYLTFCGFNDLLNESDIISLHCNLTSETENMINADAFSKMIRKPILINTARGPVINETDLLNALNNDLIHSAGIDVYTTEPPTEFHYKIISHSKVIATGHYAWYSENSYLNLQTRAAQNLLDLLNGKPIDDLLN